VSSACSCPPSPSAGEDAASGEAEGGGANGIRREGRAGRDERLDLLRGLCLFKMMLTHLWPQPLSLQPLFGYVSAAEGFFLISGATTAIVFGRRAERSGFAPAAQGLARRGVHLYLLNLALVFLFFAAETTRVLPYSQLRPPGFSTLELFDFNQPYFLQVLPRYALYLLLAPLALACLRTGRTALLVAASCGIWLLVLARGGRVPVPFLEVGPHGGFFLLSWQLLFYGGMVLGFHRERIGALWRRLPTALTLALPGLLYLAFVLLGLAEARGALGPLGWDPEVSRRLLGRAHLPPGRLLDLAVTALFLFAVVDRWWRPIRRAAGWLLLPFGRNALYIFLAHTVTYGFFLSLGPRLPFEMYGHPWRLALAGFLHLVLLWVLARWTPLGRLLELEPAAVSAPASR
jgi:hypothetical protein